MKYIYYREDCEITMISPVIDAGTTDAFIEVADDLADKFLKGKSHPSEYCVIPDPRLPGGGTIKEKNPPVPIQPPIPVSEKVYLVPLSTDDTEFRIKHNTESKTVEIYLSAAAEQWWKDNDFLNREEIYLIACVPADPHLVLWDWFFKSKDLGTTPIVKNYTGTDQLRFYTRKIFKSYSHEKFN